MAIERSLEITNKYGLHARASTRLAQLAQNYKASITIARESGDQEVDAKSVLGILSLGAEHGEKVRVRVHGDSEKEAAAAMEAVTKLFLDKFDEE